MEGRPQLEEVGRSVGIRAMATAMFVLNSNSAALTADPDNPFLLQTSVIDITSPGLPYLNLFHFVPGVANPAAAVGVAGFGLLPLGDIHERDLSPWSHSQAFDKMTSLPDRGWWQPLYNPSDGEQIQEIPNTPEIIRPAGTGIQQLRIYHGNKFLYTAGSRKIRLHITTASSVAGVIMGQFSS